MTIDTISSRSTKAFFWVTGGAFGKVAGQLLVQVTLARLLDPVSFGQYAAMLVVYGLGYILADGGFGSALIQKKELHSEDVSLALGWSLMFASVIVLLIFLLAPLLANQFGDAALEPMIRVCSILIPFQIVSNISNSLLRRDLHMRGIQIIGVISYTVFFGGVAIVFAIMGWGAWSLIAGFASQTIFSLVATYSISRHTLRIRLMGDRAIIHFGLKSMAIEFTSWFMGSIPQFLVGKFWGVYSLGLYSVAFNLSRAPAVLLVSASQSIAFASAARLHDNLAAVRKGFQVVLAAIALATLPIFSLAAFESEAVLNIVYGAKWIKAAPYMTALAVSIPFFSMGSITAAILRGTGGVGTELRIQLVAGVILLGGFLISHDVSLAIAAWAVPLAYLVQFLLLLRVVRARLELRMMDILHSFRGGFVLSAVGLSMAALVHRTPEVASIGMGVMPILAGCCAILLLLVFKFSWLLGEPLTALVNAKFFKGRLGATAVSLDKGTVL